MQRFIEARRKSITNVNENTYANGKYYLQKWHINSKFYEKVRQLVG